MLRKLSSLSSLFPLEGAVVLVVDDVVENTRQLKFLLSAVGCQVIEATSAQAARAVLKHTVPDVILLDIMMPDTDGMTLCEEWRRETRFADVQVIFISGLTDATDKVRAFAIGGSDFVTKPFEPTEVLARVSHLFRMRRMHLALLAEREELLRLNRQLQRARQETVEVFELLAEQLQGKVLSDKYRLEERIGTGGSAIVYRATHLQLQRSVAVKVLRPAGISRSAQLMKRFSREATSSARIHHPNVVAVLDADVTADGLPYLVMELLSGQALCDVLQPGVPLSAARTLEILIPICSAISHAHSVGIVHRDIKPANIFLHREGNREVVKLLDFGIAQFFDTSEESEPRFRSREELVGTLCYMSPEQMDGSLCDGKCDVYGLGVTLYELLTGQLPFPCGRDATLAALRKQMAGPIRVPSALCPALSPAIDRMVIALLSVDPTQRPTAEELLSQLLALVHPIPDPALSEGKGIGSSRRSPVSGVSEERTEGHP